MQYRFIPILHYRRLYQSYYFSTYILQRSARSKRQDPKRLHKKPDLMKLRLIFLTFCFYSIASTQVLDRLYLNMEKGIPKNINMGIVAHVFKYFSIAAYSGSTRLKVGESYVVSSGVIFSRSNQLQNIYKSKYLLFGLTTQTHKRLNGSLLFGPSWTRAEEFTNIQIHKNEYSHTEHPTYDKVYRNVSGYAFRADCILEAGKGLGFNLGLQYIHNPIRGEWTVQVGMNMGIVRHISDESWRRTKK
jgi:hypothetical protein